MSILLTTPSNKEVLDKVVNPQFRTVLEATMHSTHNFAKTFFPAMVNKPFEQAHIDFMNLLDNRESWRKAIKIPRGSGKTTLIQIYVVRNMVWKLQEFIVYVNETETTAIAQGENIKAMLYTPLIQEIFGSPKVRSEEDGFESSFSKKIWVYNGFCTFMPRGTGQQMRGLNVQIGDRRVRPTLMLFDDWQNKKEEANADIREANKAWFFGDAMYTEEMGEQRTMSVACVDTYKNEDNTLEALLDSPEWDSLDIPLFYENDQGNLVSNFPKWKSDAYIAKERDNMEKLNQLDVFYQEMGNRRSHLLEKKLTDEFFVKYSERDKKFINFVKPRLNNIALFDPTKKGSMATAMNGFCIFGVDTFSRKVYLRYATAMRDEVDKILTTVVEKAIEYNCRYFCPEVTGLNDYLMNPIKQKCIDLSYYPELVELKSVRGRGEFNQRGGAKLEREVGYRYYLFSKIIHHSEEVDELYYKQLKHQVTTKDIKDVAGYLPFVLEELNMYLMDLEDEYNSQVIEEEFETEPLDGFRTLI
jgi:hypothetical protein